jgi:hypothetical protein
MLLIAAPAAHAAPPRLIVQSARELSFGSFVVFTQGSRTVTATGAVTGSSVFPVAQDRAFPASFTVTYDRGNESRRPISLVIQLQLLSPAPLASGGITGSLSAFSTDLAGYGAITPGQTMTVAIDNCVTRTCSRSFRIGARLDVVRSYGGGKVTMPLPVSAVLVAVK